MCFLEDVRICRERYIVALQARERAQWGESGPGAVLVITAAPDEQLSAAWHSREVRHRQEGWCWVPPASHASPRQPG
jgi:hypothetical protein